MARRKLITPKVQDELEDYWKLVRPNKSGGRTHVRYLVDKIFGHLTVTARAGTNKHGASLWQCRCSLCGGHKVISRPALLSGRVKSCGCLKAKHRVKTKAVDPDAPRKPRKSLWSRLQDKD